MFAPSSLIFTLTMFDQPKTKICDEFWNQIRSHLSTCHQCQDAIKDGTLLIEEIPGLSRVIRKMLGLGHVTLHDFLAQTIEEARKCQTGNRSENAPSGSNVSAATSTR